MAVNDIVMGAAGGSADATYIEDVFSSFLYTGNGSTQTITNGIDLSGKGGMVWIKARTNGSGVGTFGNNQLASTELGLTNSLCTNDTSIFTDNPPTVGSVSATGFVTTNNARVAYNGNTFASWTFRKQPKFFDIVTYTGNGVAGRTVAHNLGSTPGCIIVKRTNGVGSWVVYHRSLGATKAMELQTTGASFTDASVFSNTEPTSTNFCVGNASGGINTNGETYVAYLFAHDAGGFGLTGSDNVISCGSYTGNSSATGPTVTLGYEPQYLMIKNASATGNWNIIDNMRGMPVGSADAYLEANTSDAEASAEWVTPTATGFQIVSTSSEVNTNTNTYIYIAIRRGLMKTPTTGTQVYNAVTYTGNGSSSRIIGSENGFPSDLALFCARSTIPTSRVIAQRITGDKYMETNKIDSQSNSAAFFPTTAFSNQSGVTIGSSLNYNDPIYFISYHFKRAPGFFDVVCYTGNGTTQNINHNLGVVPELIIVKRRNSTGAWGVYSAPTGNSALLQLESTGAVQTGAPQWNSTTPTSTVFSLGSSSTANASGGTYVAYLFASCPGVSKVGSYTGNGSTQTINCGFAAGSRYVLIKRTDSTGDWYVWDSARGIVASNDPHLSLNSTAAEVTTDDSVDTDNTGFIVNQNSATNINVNGATYIYLAIA